MIKDIVVNLSVGERASPAEDYAISVAGKFDACVAGIAFLYHPIVPVRGAGYTLADLYGSRSGAGVTGCPTSFYYPSCRHTC